MSDSVRIIPLGGFDKIGMNMTLIESGDGIIAVDFGMSCYCSRLAALTVTGFAH